MMEPRRLLADQPTDLERVLLESAAKERPTEAHRIAMRRALYEAAPRATAAAASGGTAAMKAAVVGLVATTIVGLVLFQRARGTKNEGLELNGPPTMHALSAPVVEAPVVALPPAAPARTEPAALAIAPPSRARSEGARGAGRATASAGDASDVRDQIRMIDEARSAMSRREPATALRTIDRYVAKYPEGMFQQEAGILRILALDDRGDHSRASSLARAFLASHPTSAHVARIERIATR